MNVSDDTDVIIFYNELSSLVQQIPKYNVLIIGGDTNTYRGKGEHHKFCLSDSPNRNGKHLTEYFWTG